MKRIVATATFLFVFASFLTHKATHDVDRVAAGLMCGAGPETWSITMPAECAESIDCEEDEDSCDGWGATCVLHHEDASGFVGYGCTPSLTTACVRNETFVCKQRYQCIVDAEGKCVSDPFAVTEISASSICLTTPF
jgi:hypothetical protein